MLAFREEFSKCFETSSKSLISINTLCTIMSLKEVMILFAIFSIGSLLPGKHWLIETEDGGDHSRRVPETKSKILALAQLP